jgi:hypothetical protein
MGWNLPPGCTDADIDRAAPGYDCEDDNAELEPYGQTINGVWWTQVALDNLYDAAPELLEAGKPVADILGFAEWASPHDAELILRDLIENHYTKFRAAIAKAEGKP